MPFGISSLLPGRAQCKWTFSFQVSRILLPAQGSLFNISQHRGRRLLRVPWTTRRSNQSILKEISPRCSLEWLMLKLKLQHFGHLMRRVDLLENTLTLGGIKGRCRRGWQRMRWLDDITDSMHMSLSEFRDLMMDREPWHAVMHVIIGHDWVTELNWTDWWLIHVVVWQKQYSVKQLSFNKKLILKIWSLT